MEQIFAFILKIFVIGFKDSRPARLADLMFCVLLEPVAGSPLSLPRPPSSSSRPTSPSNSRWPPFAPSWRPCRRSVSSQQRQGRQSRAEVRGPMPCPGSRQPPLPCLGCCLVSPLPPHQPGNRSRAGDSPQERRPALLFPSLPSPLSPSPYLRPSRRRTSAGCPRLSWRRWKGGNGTTWRHGSGA